jgi:hypothetical protein
MNDVQGGVPLQAVSGGEPGPAGAGGEPQPAREKSPARVSIPEELRPEVDAYVNRAVEHATNKVRREMEATLAERERLARLSESERLAEEASTLKSQVEALRGANSFLEMQLKVNEIVSRSGFVPPEIVDAVLREHVSVGTDPSPEVIAKEAAERFQSYLPQMSKATKVPPQSARSGTPVGRPDPNDFNSMSEEQVRAHAKGLGGMRGNLYLTDYLKFLSESR